MTRPSRYSEQHRRQRRKNFAMLALLGSLVLLFYVISIVRMSAQ